MQRGLRTIARAARESNLPIELIEEQAYAGNVGQLVKGTNRFLFSWEDVQWLIQNVEIPEPPPPIRIGYQSKEWLYEQLWEEEKTVNQIAQENDITASTVRYWCDRLDVPRPGRREARLRSLNQ